MSGKRDDSMITYGLVIMGMFGVAGLLATQYDGTMPVALILWLGGLVYGGAAVKVGMEKH
jgi:hypothetical protein